MSTLQKSQGELLILPRRIHRSWPWLKVRPGHGGASHTGVSHMGETSWTRPLRSEVALSREGSREKGPPVSEAGGAENGRVFCDFPPRHGRRTFPGLRPRPPAPPSSPHQVLPGSPHSPRLWGNGGVPQAARGRAPSRPASHHQPGLAGAQPARPPALQCARRPPQAQAWGSSVTNNRPSFVTRPRRKCFPPPLPEDSGGQVGVSARP